MSCEVKVLIDGEWESVASDVSVSEADSVRKRILMGNPLALVLVEVV